MIFEFYTIEEPLSKYVESMFYHKDYMPEHSIERVVPTGHIFILFELDNFPRHTFDQNLKPNAAFTKVWVSGINQKYLNISAHKNSEMLVVQLKTLGAYPLFKVPIESFSESVMPAENYFGNLILDIRENLMTAESINDKFLIIKNWLQSQIDESLAPSQSLLDMLSVLQDNPFSKHGELIQNYPNTQKHLINQFKKYSGLSPKTLHKIIRFNSILQIINQSKEIKWTDIVYETGYTDQSHFIKEFQEFSGFNPSKYIKMGYNESIPNFFPIDPEG